MVVALVLVTLRFASVARGQSLQDLFANRETITSTGGQIEQSNTNATVEPGEPNHGGKPGGHSLWISWVAPTNGIIRFKTETSDFDTLLSAYQFITTNGSSFAELREVSRADDSEGFERESEIEFGVLTGEHYEIAVDGYYGAVGTVDFSWNFDPLPLPPAQILSSPADRSVKIGDTVSLSMNVTNAAAGTFKWYFNGNEIPSATTTNLAITSFQATNVGRYKFRVSFNGGVHFFSIPTEIQINTDGSSNTLAQPKLLDAPSTPLIGTVDDGGSTLRVQSLVFGGGTKTPLNFGVVRGYNGSQIFNTTYAVTDPLEPPHCDVVGGASYWLMYQPPTNGTITLDTLGSTYDTVMEVYSFNSTPTNYSNLIKIACNDNVSPSNTSSRVVFPVVKTRQYLVAVDGVGGARGTAWLNYKLNTNQLPQAPTLTSMPQPSTVAVGSNVVLTAPVTGSPPMLFTWRKDGGVISGATLSSLVLGSVASTQSGNYTFSVTNDVGGPVSATFPVKVVVVPRSILSLNSNALQLSFLTATGQLYTIEEATNVTGPWASSTNPFSGNGQTNTIDLVNVGTKFYRVRVE